MSKGKDKTSSKSKQKKAKKPKPKDTSKAKTPVAKAPPAKTPVAKAKAPPAKTPVAKTKVPVSKTPVSKASEPKAKVPAKSAQVDFTTSIDREGPAGAAAPPSIQTDEKPSSGTGTTDSKPPSGTATQPPSGTASKPPSGTATSTDAAPDDMPHRHKPVVFVIGGPGSGKGTQCDKIKAQFGFTHLSTGDLLRDEVASGSEKGKQLNEIMKSGKLVPNEEVLNLLRAAIEGKSAQSHGFLIDGYPREVGQAIEFEKKVCSASVVMYFECSDAEMTRRLLNRGKTSGRADDNEETIKKRLDTFHLHTQPILDHFKGESKLETVNTERTEADIYTDVEQIIKKLEAR